jgi:hypothetical protein
VHVWETDWQVPARRASGDQELATELRDELGVSEVDDEPGQKSRRVSVPCSSLALYARGEGPMNIEERVEWYRAIEAHRGRPLIVYATSSRANVRALMAGDAVREMIDQVDAIADGNAVDVLLHSMGGDALAAWKIMSVLRERFDTVGVLVPFAAFSAATVFALGANEIVMHPYASLGPIDPQITVKLPDGTMRQFAYEDLGAFLGWLHHDVGLTEQQHVSPVVDKLFNAMDPLIVGAAKRASELSAEVGERLLSMHLPDDRKARQIALNLNKSFFAHGDAVSRKRAKKLELQVADPDAELERLIWNAYLGLESYMGLRTPFVPLSAFLAEPGAAATLAPTAPLAVPPDIPPPVVQKIWEAAANQALQRAQTAGIEVGYSLVNAVVEGGRVASEYRTDGRISAIRQPTGEIRLTLTETNAGWRSVQIPPAPVP